MISIFTSCIKRELYLYRLLESIRTNGGWQKIDFEHFIIFQGEPPSEKMKDYIYSLPFSSRIKTGKTDKIEPVGTLLNESIARARFPIFFKIDDDCALLSPDFLFRASELCAKLPTAAVYPCNVDGEVFTGAGNPRLNQSVFLEKSNLYVTLGEAVGVSGKFFLPTELAKKIKFEEQKDPEIVRMITIQLHIPVFLALNGLVIETQEGLSGQYHRVKDPEGQKW